MQLVFGHIDPFLAHNDYKGNNKQTILKCRNVVSLTNAKKQIINAPPLVSHTRAKAFQNKNQACKTGQKRINFHLMMLQNVKLYMSLCWVAQIG